MNTVQDMIDTINEYRSENVAHYVLGVITAIQGYEPLIVLLGGVPFVLKVGERGKTERVSFPYYFFDNGRSGNAGHAKFFDERGLEWNSYLLKHQVNQSHQCCGTFALMYAIERPENEWVSEGGKVKMVTRENYFGGGYSLGVGKYAENVQECARFWLSVWEEVGVRGLIDEVLDIHWNYIYWDEEPGYDAPDISTVRTRSVYAKMLLEILENDIDVAQKLVSESGEPYNETS